MEPAIYGQSVISCDDGITSFIVVNAVVGVVVVVVVVVVLVSPLRACGPRITQDIRLLMFSLHAGYHSEWMQDSETQSENKTKQNKQTNKQ